jgi:hypothetical protein
MSTLFDEVASPEAPGEDENGGPGSDRKRLFVVGGVGAAVVLGALGYFVVVPALSGGSGNSSQPTPVITHHVATATPKAKAKPAVKAAAKPSPASVPTVSGVQNALQTGKDPFAPLVVQAAASASPAASSSPSTAGTTTGTTGTTGLTAGATPTPSVSTVSSTGTLVLKRIYQQDNLWHVDTTWNGQAFSAVKDGDFAGIFSFVSESNGKTATFTYAGGQQFVLTINGSKTF